MLTTALSVLLLELDSAHGGSTPTSSAPLKPVAVTAEKIPYFDGLGEIQQHKHEELERQTRDIEREELTTYRKIWTDGQISNYRFTVSMRGAWSGVAPVTVTVRAGQVVSSEYVGEADPVAKAAATAAAEPYSTIPKLFALIESLLDHDMTLPRVHYDKQYGFPAHIANNRIAIADDEWTMQVWNFQPLQ